MARPNDLIKSSSTVEIGGEQYRLDDLTAADYLRDYLHEHPELVEIDDTIPHRYFVTDLTESVQLIADRIFQRSMELQQI